MPIVKKQFGAVQLTFSEKVVHIAHMIPKGCVMTYGGIARAAGGGAMSAQSITAILGKAYEGGDHRIPFHRIVYADGRVWLDDKHCAERLRLYKKEKIELDAKCRIVDLNAYLFDPRGERTR